MSLAEGLGLKPGGFFMYPCRGVLHTPRNVLRQGFGSKIGRVLGISLLGWVKSGGFSAYPDGEMWNRAGFSCTRVGAYCIRPSNSLAEGLGVKLGVFFMYPCRGVLHTPPNILRRRFGSKIGQVLGVSLLERVESGAFLAGMCFGRRGGSGVFISTNGDRQNASQIRPIFAASN